MSNDFGLPNDQDSFGDLGKEKKREYKAFDWSDSSKFDHVRNNILPVGMQQFGQGMPQVAPGTLPHQSSFTAFPPGYPQNNMLYNNTGSPTYPQQGTMGNLQPQGTMPYTGVQSMPTMTALPTHGAPSSFPVTNTFPGPSSVGVGGVLPTDSRLANNNANTAFSQPLPQQPSFVQPGSFTQAGFAAPNQPTAQAFNHPGASFQPSNPYNQQATSFNQPLAPNAVFNPSSLQQTSAYNQSTYTQTIYSQQTTLQQTSFNQQVAGSIQASYNAQGGASSLPPSSFNVQAPPASLVGIPASNVASGSTWTATSANPLAGPSAAPIPITAPSPVPLAGQTPVGSVPLSGSYTQPSGFPQASFPQHSGNQQIFSQPQQATTSSIPIIPPATQAPQYNSGGSLPSASFAGHAAVMRTTSASDLKKVAQASAATSSFPTIAPPNALPSSVASMNFTPMTNQVPPANNQTTSPIIQAHHSSQATFHSNSTVGLIHTPNVPVNPTKLPANNSYNIPASTTMPATNTSNFAQNSFPQHPPSPQISHPPATPPPSHSSPATTPSPKTSGTNFSLPPPPSSSRQHNQLPRQSPSSLALNGNAAQAPPLALEGHSKEDDSFFLEMNRAKPEMRTVLSDPGFKGDLEAYRRAANLAAEEQWKAQNEAQILRDVEEKHRREIEEKVRRELEEKHRAEMTALRKQLEEQKQKDIADIGGTPPTRPRSRSHGGEVPLPLLLSGGLVDGTSPDVSPTTASFFSQNFDTVPPIQVVGPPAAATVAATTAKANASAIRPPPRNPSSRQAPPSPSLTADPSAPERRSRVKGDLEAILRNPQGERKPLPSVPTQAPASREIPIPSVNTVNCPICNEPFVSERAVSVHMDDAHPINGHKSLPIVPKSVTFAQNTLVAPSQSSGLSLSPLQKSRSAESLDMTIDPLFGLDDFNPRGGDTPARPVAAAPTKKETPQPKKEESSKKFTVEKVFSFKGRSKDSGAPTQEKPPQRIVDIGEVMGAPAGFGKAAPYKSNSLQVMSAKKSRSLTGPQAVRQSEADLMTGSPRPPVRNPNEVKGVLTPMVKRERKEYTPETAAAKIQATYRMWILHRQYKKHLFRAKVIKELVTTEHTYVESLEKVLQTFAVPLRHAIESGKPLCSAEDISALFSKLEEVLTVNRVLCEKMTLRVMKWSVVSKISDVFTEALNTPCNGLDFKKVYNDCTLSYNLMLETLERCCKEKSAFKQFIKNGEKSFWGQAGNSIQAFFILPVQRITRYILLVKEAIRHTHPAHPDYDLMGQLLIELQAMCTDVNENQRREDIEKTRIQTLTNIANKIEPKLKDLVIDGRVLLREGIITQFDPEDDQIKERYYFLFNDIMLITREQKKRFQMRVHITLNNVRLKDIPDNQNFLGHVITNAFEMHTPSMSLMFMLPTQDEKDTFYKELVDVVNNLLEAIKQQQ